MKCLYNGVGLPVVPQMESVQNCAIAKAGDDRYYAFYSNTPIVWEGETRVGLGRNNYPSGMYAVLLLTDGAWPNGEPQSTATGVFQIHKGLVWANHDIKDEDGTLYLAASDPVPVSPVQINPALLVQSFFTGQALRRNRT